MLIISQMHMFRLINGRVKFYFNW